MFIRGSGALKRCTLISGNLINEFKIKEPRGNGLRLMFEGIFLQAEKRIPRGSTEAEIQGWLFA